MAELHESAGALKRLKHLLHTTPALVPMIVLVLPIIGFGLYIGERFFSASTLSRILQQVQIVGILAAAQTLVVLTAVIDLSVGAIMELTSVIMGLFTFRYGLPPAVAVFCGLCAGALLGHAKGWLVARLRLPPFSVAPGTWQIILASNFPQSRN